MKYLVKYTIYAKTQNRHFYPGEEVRFTESDQGVEELVKAGILEPILEENPQKAKTTEKKGVTRGQN